MEGAGVRESRFVFVGGKYKVHMWAFRLWVCPGVVRAAPMSYLRIGCEQVVDTAECS